jgi:hypothetical protein
LAKASGWQIEPGVGIGPVEFGMTCDELLGLFGEPDELHTAPADGPTSGWLWRGRLFVTFDEDGHAVEIDVFRRTGVSVTLDGVNLLGASGTPAADVLARIDPGTRTADWISGYEAPALHLTLWRDRGDRSRWDGVLLVDESWLGRRRPDRTIVRPVLTAEPWAVRPGRSVGPVHAAMTRPQVDAILGPPKRATVADGQAFVTYDEVEVTFTVDGILDPKGSAVEVVVYHANDERVPKLELGRVVLGPGDGLVERITRAGHRVRYVDDGRFTIDGTVEVDLNGPQRATITCILTAPASRPDRSGRA